MTSALTSRTDSSTTTGSTSSSSSSSSSTSSTSTTTDYKNMFLQLLVAQLKNQNPLSPTDSTEFVGQLAQYQQLETSLNQSEDVSALRTDIENYLGTSTSSTSSTSKS
jgi:flagellar basal-body rod modification protein FlgD